MRRNREPMEDRHKRILSSYNPTVTNAEELKETLSAVPPADAWATYLWLDEQNKDSSSRDYEQVQREFIHASIQELEGKRQEALAAFQGLETQLKRKGYNGRIVTYVDNATKRLSAP